MRKAFSLPLQGFLNLFSFNNTNLVGGYLAIWYTNDDYQSKVWIANRDTPIQDSQANLTMDADGLLKIVHDGEGSPIVLNAMNQHQTPLLL